MSTPSKYEQSGVRYDLLDPFKIACQKAAAATSGALAAHGLTEAPGTRGESAYLVRLPEGGYLAHVEEALGTKALIADAVYRGTGRSFYRHIAIDDVSTIVNDLVTTGALPAIVGMYLAVGDAGYLADPTRARDLAEGFAEGCRLSGAAWAGGETQVLKGVVEPSTMVLGGSAVGRILREEDRVAGDVEDGDAIVLLASSGLQTNGATLCRAVAAKLPEGYRTPLPGGATFGEALLAPSVIYAPFVAACRTAGIRLRYLVHLTGHGWRKLMRPVPPFVYRIEEIRPPQEVFKFLQMVEGIDDREAYATFNMGAGFAAYVRPEDADRAVEAAESAGLSAWRAGTVVRRGDRRAVEIAPLGIVYEGESLAIR